MHETPYDHYYQTPEYFGEPFPELIRFFRNLPRRGKLLDLGCGQGRNSLPLAALGYQVTGVDISSTGVTQMLAKAREQGLDIEGRVEDIYAFHRFNPYDFILLDSMFHFAKRDKAKEQTFVRTMLSSMKPGALMIICIQDMKKKIDALREALEGEADFATIHQESMTYTFVDPQTKSSSASPYQLIIIQRL